MTTKKRKKTTKKAKKLYILIFNDPECEIYNSIEELKEGITAKIGDGYDEEDLQVFEAIKKGKIKVEIFFRDL